MLCATRGLKNKCHMSSGREQETLDSYLFSQSRGRNSSSTVPGTPKWVSAVFTDQVLFVFSNRTEQGSFPPLCSWGEELETDKEASQFEENDSVVCQRDLTE